MKIRAKYWAIAKTAKPFQMTHDVNTGNLLSRQHNGNPQETFTYDNLDRLLSVNVGNTAIMTMNYADNGNIMSKSGVGSYSYDAASKPHAVSRVDNINEALPSSLLTTEFNALGKIRRIENEANHLAMDFQYGPDGERWYSELSDYTGFGSVSRTTIYGGNYEKITENGVTKEFYYLDGNVILVKQDGTLTPYLAFTDNLGSVLSILDSNGEPVFQANYDAWGQQEVTLNEIGFHRGYTGHEMLPEFGIINMNGRLYDPVLGRFFSPDNYVQTPTNSQNFNRYSYCLNNPLKYTDPTGNFCWEMVVAGAIIGAIQSGAMAEMNGENFWSGAWKGAIVGAVSAGVGMYVGGAVSGALGSAAETTSGTILSSAAGGLASGLISGAGSTWVQRGPLTSALRQSLISGGINMLSSGMIGGIESTSAVNSTKPINNPTSFDDVTVDNAIQLKNVDVIAYDYHSYALAAMNVFNQINNTNFKLTTCRALFVKAWWHYQYGGGEPMFIDASGLDFHNLHQSDINSKGMIQTFRLDNLNNTSLTIGRVTVNKAFEEQFYINPDNYNFDFRINELTNFDLVFRNVGTLGAGAIHNVNISPLLFGGDYPIYFIGTTTILP